MITQIAWCVDVCMYRCMYGYLLEEHCAAAGLSRLGKLRPRVLLARAERKGHRWTNECHATHTTPLTPCLLQANNIGPLRHGCVNHLANALVQGLDLELRSIEAVEVVSE
jgi:hypothetical protein